MALISVRLLTSWMVLAIGFTGILCNGDNQWDYMVYAQQWPSGICHEMNVTHQHKCKISANTTRWTVHGLWPTKTGTFGPNFCNKTDPFNPSKIEPILGQLIQNWPNLYSDTPLDDFWEHEWDKHGTCATSLPVLRGEFNFFSQALKLNKKLDIWNILNAKGIVPRGDYTYEYSDIVNALSKGLGGNLKVQCFIQTATKVQYLQQVEMCVNKTLNAITCPGKQNTAGCTDTLPVVYLPL